MGYDFYRNIPEFTDFLTVQARALELGESEFIADLGCGTGIFLEQLLDFVAHEGDAATVRQITAVDLVQDALDKARVKCEEAVAANPGLQGISFRYLQMDLEPNRLLPVSLFIKAKTVSLEALRNRIEGLSTGVLDRSIAKATPELYAVMQGAEPKRESVSRLASALGPSDLQVALEFNRAARFLQNRVREGDLRAELRSGSSAAHGLRCSDLVFEALNFGDCGVALDFGFPENHYSRIVTSLFISYIRNADYALADFQRMLKPGGMLLVSSMRPDSDMSIIFTNYIRKLQTPNCQDVDKGLREAGVDGARAMLNEAAGLFELEEDGFFKFYTAQELADLLSGAGFVDIKVVSSMGKPHQANVATGRKRLTLY